MISENLKSKALAFLNGVISDSHTSGVNDGKSIGYTSGYTKGYNAGLVEGKTIGYNSGYTKGYTSGETEGKTIGYNSGKTEGYNSGFADGKINGYNSGKTEGYNIGLAEGKTIGYNSGYTKGYQDGLDKQQEQVDPLTPDVPTPEPIEPDVPTGSTEEYSTEKAKSNLKALLNNSSYVFAILDKYGNAYATVEDWKNQGSKEVLGIGYCTSTRFMCMGIKRIPSSVFGGNGIKFNSKVYTTKKQWHNTSTSEIAAFDDYTGVSNTEGIMEGCNDSLAEKCYNVQFSNGKHGYMPACAELRTYCKYFSKVDKLLEGVGGDKLKTINGAQAMHSSTCKDNSYVWAVRYYKDGDAQPQANLKTQKWTTRAFVEL